MNREIFADEEKLIRIAIEKINRVMGKEVINPDIDLDHVQMTPVDDDVILPCTNAFNLVCIFGASSVRGVTWLRCYLHHKNDRTYDDEIGRLYQVDTDVDGLTDGFTNYTKDILEARIELEDRLAPEYLELLDL